MHRLHILNGPEMGRSFELKDGPTYVGRSDDNDICIEDKTVSRRHLKIVQRENKFLVMDLESENGTYVGGEVITPGLEIVVEEGTLITVGMCMICLGESPIEQTIPFLDPMGLIGDWGGESDIFRVSRDRTDQKKLEFLSKISDVIKAGMPTNKTLEKILEHVVALLKRIDRAAFILVDPETEKVLEVVSKTNKPVTGTYCTDVVTRVMEDRKPVAVSNVQTEKQDGLVDTLKILKIESVMCVPVFSDSKVIGLIYIDSLRRPYGFRREDLSLFTELAEMTTPAIKKARFAKGPSGSAKAPRPASSSPPEIGRCK
jgi:putative methionine-R-sulfoxide reductase with GAF domain